MLGYERDHGRAATSVGCSVRRAVPIPAKNSRIFFCASVLQTLAALSRSPSNAYVHATSALQKMLTTRHLCRRFGPKRMAGTRPLTSALQRVRPHHNVMRVAARALRTDAARGRTHAPAQRFTMQHSARRAFADADRPPELRRQQGRPDHPGRGGGRQDGARGGARPRRGY